MKKPLLKYLSPLFFILLFTACAQHDITLDPTQDEEVVTRSTQAECDSIQATLPQVTDENFCHEFANLLECRLNQGINETDVAANCTKIASYAFQVPHCITVSELLLNYPTLVASLKQEVYQSTSGCPPSFCPGPTTIDMCRTIIFKVTFIGSACPNGPCGLKIEAIVYCCL